VCAVGVVHGERQTVTKAVVHMRLQEQHTKATRCWAWTACCRMY
jgi:hypothetical protein